MKIIQNLSSKATTALKKFIEDESIIICPADKGRAIVIEDRDVYL
jgi:hypothetical protein